MGPRKRLRLTRLGDASTERRGYSREKTTKWDATERVGSQAAHAPQALGNLLR
jgi:hypothetical protein